ncbi:bucky ball [Lampris incognitus]|uniref:bucky ball n=1 Tax=Lampris incognitus TaxID=2546036 RepID=UPI0024B5053F|nr:bucky ball [Lampris incognitus]
MDDGGRPPHPSGGGEQRPHHIRPFFYVQPPSQPYYMYQHWHVNHPYSQYGLPGGYNFGRPCVQPYPYMQYPTFVVPQAPVHPLDYRRMFEPRFQSPNWNDAVHHQYHPQAQVRRETACSEAQTDPSDAITKLIECLNKIKASELGGERELDSGVASQTSGLFSPQDEKKNEEQTVHTSSSVATEVSGTQSQTKTFSSSTTAVYDSGSSQRSLEDLSPRECWVVGFDEELPLDSSSVHEESPSANQLAADDSRFLPQRPPERLRKGKIQSETPAVNITELQSDGMQTGANVPKCNTEEVKQNVDAFAPQLPCSSVSCPSTNQQVLANNKNGDVLKAEYLEGAEVDLSFQILSMPLERSPTADALLTDVDPLSGGADTTLTSPHLLSSSSSVPPYCYSYLPNSTAHERMSVLSPSLDELSSRDEMFSTDLEELDLFPKHGYATRRSTKVVGRSPPSAEGVRGVRLTGSKRFTCACCGKSLMKAASRNQAQSSMSYSAEVGDSDEECRYRRSHEQHSRLAGKRHSVSRKPQTILPRPALKQSCKRGQHIDPSSTQDPEEVLDLGEEDTAEGEIDEMTGSDLQCRACQDGLCGKDVAISVQGRRKDGDVNFGYETIDNQPAKTASAKCPPCTRHIAAKGQAG